MSRNRKIQEVLDALAQGSTEVRSDPSEENYRKWENKLDRIAQDESSIGAYLIVGMIIAVVFMFFLLRETKRPFVEIANDLRQPVYLYAYGNIDIGLLAPNTTQRVEFSGDTIDITWKQQRVTMSSGVPLGNEIGETYTNLSSSSVLTIDNVLGGNIYMFPIVYNRTDSDCDFSIDDGYVSESRPNAFVPAHTDGVVLGYYRIFSNSNITFRCDDGIMRWWGEHPTYGGTRLSFPDSSDGVLYLTLTP